MLRFLTAGESHGKAEVAILEGMPAGLTLSENDINQELKKRMWDFGRGRRGKIETDTVEILSGVRFEKTIGSPIALLVKNQDQAKWEDKVTRPRPGHADLAGSIKYGFDDVRNVLERASARETIMRVAAGAVCKKFLLAFATRIASHTVQIGDVCVKEGHSFEQIQNVFKVDPEVRCVDKDARARMKEAIGHARLSKDTLGGIVEVVAHNVIVGLGSHVHFDRRLDGRIAQALMSIPSVKAVEIGNGVAASTKTGKEVQDAVYVDENQKIYRKTNNMGGVEGGISNGEDIICRVYHKPLSTIYDPLSSVDIKTLTSTVATVERSDVCVVARAGVVSEAMLAFVLTQALLEKFGGDSIAETKRNFENYINSLPIKL